MQIMLMKLKIISWNINGIRAMMKKDNLYNLIEEEKPDIIWFGETKISCPFIDIETELKDKISGLKYRYWSPCLTKGGYSGTAIFSKKKPIDVTYGLPDDLDQEGRVITLEYEKFYLLHVYTPNSGQALKRLEYRVNTWDVEFRKYVKNLNKKKPIIVTGDLNVAHNEIDISNPKGNLKNSGFTVEERESFSKLLNDVNLIDSYRHLYPEKIEYSFWTYLHNSRAKNKGWRIDYFLVPENKKKWIKESQILTQVMGSDHAPVSLSLSIS